MICVSLRVSAVLQCAHMPHSSCSDVYTLVFEIYGRHMEYDPVHTGSNRLASISSKTLHLAGRAHGRLVCVAALSSYGKLKDNSGHLLSEAQLLGPNTFCRRSFFPRSSEATQNESEWTDSRGCSFVLKSLL